MKIIPLVMSLYFFLAGPVWAKELSFVTHPLSPFVYQDNGKLAGVAVDLVRLMMKENNYQPSFVLMPFPRVLRLIQTHTDMAGFIVARTPEREDTVKWVGPLISSGVYLYKRKGHAISQATLSELNGKYTIGVAKSNADHAYLTKLNFETIYPVSHQLQTLKMLLRGRVDLIPVSELVLPAMAEKADIDISGIERTSIKLYDSVLYLAFSSNVDQAEIANWQLALDKLKVTGKYQRVIDRYILTDEHKIISQK